MKFYRKSTHYNQSLLICFSPSLNRSSRRKLKAAIISNCLCSDVKINEYIKKFLINLLISSFSIFLNFEIFQKNNITRKRKAAGEKKIAFKHRSYSYYRYRIGRYRIHCTLHAMIIITSFVFYYYIINQLVIPCHSLLSNWPIGLLW